MKRRQPAARFLSGRILLRRVLGAYMSRDPAALCFTYSANGKPELEGSDSLKPTFSLTHAGHETLLAVAGDGELGVDMELTARAAAAERIACRFFSPSEQKYLSDCGNDRDEKALILWSLKESIVKARGDTVWEGLSEISIMAEGHRIDWTAPGMKQQLWRVAAGPFGVDRILAVALKIPPGTEIRQPVFRQYRLDAETPDRDVFTLSMSG